MKKINQKQKIQQQLSQNYGILHLLLKREEFSSLQYQQLMYILQNGRIQMSSIAYFKKKIYKDEQPLMRKSFIIKDAIKLREDVIQKVWRFQRTQKRTSIKQQWQDKSRQKIDRQRSKTQARYQENQQQQNQKITKINSRQQKQIPRSTQKQNNYHSIKQQRIQDKNRKKQIQQELIILQGKMNITHNEQQAADYQKLYKKLYKQLTYLRNKYRIDRQNRLIKQISQTNQSCITKQIKQILQKMKQIKCQNSKVLHRQAKYKQKISKVEQITRLNKIFDYYCKKLPESSPTKYFSDLQKSQSKLNLQTFIKFCQDWNIMRIITIQQIVNIFKSHRKKSIIIDNIQFAQILTDIHKCQCIKQDKSINNQSISQYIQQYIVPDHKINSILYGLDVSKQKNKNKGQNRYKPKSHSGKYIQDIKQQLKNRKKTIDFLAGPRNVVKFNQKRANSKNVNINTLQNSQVIHTRQANYNEHTNNKSAISSLNDSLDSYAFRFKLKNVKNRVKTEGIIKTLQNSKLILSKKDNEVTIESNRQNIHNRSQSPTQNSNQLNDLINKQQKIVKNDTQNLISKNQDIPKKKTIPFEGFEDLIEQSQEDEYLNKHLLPPIQPKRGLSKHIHY